MAAATVPGPAMPDPAERGSLRLADRVLARIAARAAVEALAAHTGPDTLTAPRSTAGQGRRGVSVELGLDLPYPVDIAAVTREVHDRVVERLAQLAGADDPAVALVVERLVTATPAGGVE